VAPRQRSFWLVADAELIVYGATDPSASLSIGGEAVPISRRGNQLEAEIPPGEHRIQLGSGLPEPMPPQILRSIHSPSAATIFFTTVASADHYRIETSRDGGETWSSAGESKSGEFRLGNLPPGKTHARVVALNATTASRPGKAVNSRNPLFCVPARRS
jgi:hypothetical protein